MNLAKGQALAEPAAPAESMTETDTRTGKQRRVERLKANASRGGVRLLAGCAAFNLTLAAIGWLWQGGYVASALVGKLTRGAPLSLGSWDWNALHVLLWWVWLSGWFAFVAAKGQSDKARGPDLHKPAMTAAAAGSAASMFWLWALWDVARSLRTIDAGGLASSSASAGMLGWTGLPLAIGAGTAILVAIVLFRWPFPASEKDSQRAGDESPPREPDVASHSKSAEASPQSAVRSLQLGLTIISMAAFGLFGQFVAFGPAESTWSLDRLFHGPAAEGWAALTFLVVGHVAHVFSGALTVFDRGELEKVETARSEAEASEVETSEAARDEDAP